MAQSTSGDIVLDCQIKTHDGWVAGAKFPCKIAPERAQVAQFITKTLQKDINVPHKELGHP